MRAKVFSIEYDFENKEFDDEEFATFIATHRVKFIRKEFFVCRDVPCWTFVVEYETYSGGRKRYINYDQDTVENEPDEFLVEKLKAWRIIQAQKKALPVYMVVTNSTINNIASKKPMSKEALAKIQGIGKSKMIVYGDDILRILKEGKNDQELPDIQPVVQHDEPSFDSEREVSEVDEVCVDKSDPESLF